MEPLTDIEQKIIRAAAEDPGGWFKTRPNEDPVKVGSEPLAAALVEKGISGLVDKDLLMKISKGAYQLTGDGWVRATKQND